MHPSQQRRHGRNKTSPTPTATTCSVWYMKPEHFREGICGLFSHPVGGGEPKPLKLHETHVHLRNVQAADLNEVYALQQAEVWSPNGEARDLIAAKGLQHTSMSVGDVIVDKNGEAWVVASFGFTRVAIDRLALDRMVVTRLVENALAQGYAVRVHDSQEELPRRTTVQEVLSDLYCTDEEWLRFYRGSHLIGSVLLVHGNDGWDVIADYTTGATALVRSISDFTDQLSQGV